MRLIIEKYKCKYVFMYLCTIIAFMISMLLDNRIAIYVIALITLALNIIICHKEWKAKFVYMLFQFCIFLFLLSKPLGSLLLGNEYINRYTSDQYSFCMLCIELSEIGLGIAAIVYYDNFANSDVNTIETDNYLQSASFYIFIISFLCSIYEMVGKVAFFSTHPYLDYYNGGYTNDYVPAVLKIGMQLMVPSMCIFLSTLPSRKKSMIVLYMYTLSFVPVMIVGQRAPLILAVFFDISYFATRDFFNRNSETMQRAKEWLSKRKIRLILLLIPFAMLFLTLQNEFRNNMHNSTIISNKMAHPVAYFFLEQGGTIDLLKDYYSIKDTLPKRNYLFGYLYDAFMNNDIVSTIVGRNIAGSHTLEYLNQTHALSAQLGYKLLGNGFLQGMGTDCSYVLNIYSTLGFVGVFIINILLGYYLCKFPRLISQKNFGSVIMMYSCLNIFQIPRSDIMISFSFLVTPYFWFAVLVCYGAASVLRRRDNI